MLNEKAYKQKHYPWSIWKTVRGNYRALLPNKKERSFKTWKEARSWIESYKEKQSILKHLETQRITPKTEIRRVVGVMRKVIEKKEEAPINFELEYRRVMAALTKIHTRMVDE